MRTTEERIELDVDGMRTTEERIELSVDGVRMGRGCGQVKP
jgi:hypothetical protein